MYDPVQGVYYLKLAGRKINQKGLANLFSIAKKEVKEEKAALSERVLESNHFIANATSAKVISTLKKDLKEDKKLLNLANRFLKNPVFAFD